jgi:hypothetical protein
LLEGERLLAEQFAPPARERRHVGVGGDSIEIVELLQVLQPVCAFASLPAQLRRPGASWPVRATYSV